MLTGAHSEDEARELYTQITKLMALGSMNIRKWTSNSKQLLQVIPEESREKGVIEIKEDDTIKPLGIHWNPTKDEFQFTIQISLDGHWTKRGILSKIASIFDPTGWLSPVILRAKLIIQSLWKEQIGWDGKPSNTLLRSWKNFCQDISAIKKIRISRWTGYAPRAQVQLHGFSHASDRAYAACVYMRVTQENITYITLLASKTKVVPLKGKITIPRMELCGAVLLAKLLKHTANSLDMEISQMYAWCDSEITLAWIDKDPATWQTYVANRVNKIHQHTSKNICKHVASEDNPADHASRGLSAADLVDCKLWWRGP
ncbi:uncharacterized protein LOC129809337 [Phlebotomus papatasi]|uniref:uncharacterized protein LOC129809337 n=1 Tax=Phlebotomus papatasi TaxID=29031 RepID=UPI002483AF05|nr:uncharacterized protein LOC129809337 [Phlebotomus papatasi]